MNGGDLVGKYFHSIVDDTVQWKGVVIGRPEPGWYLLQLFSWVMGEHSNQQLVRIEEMRGWLFTLMLRQCTTATNTAQLVLIASTFEERKACQ